MICPCCGGQMETDGLSCSCGARVVGHPLTEPEHIVPKIGKPVTALVLGLLGTLSFAWKLVLPLPLFALILAYKAIKQAKADPKHYGGLRTAKTALSFSLLIVIGFTSYVVAGIPKYLRARAEKQQAATRAQMYKLAIALQQYKKEHGSYPRSLADLDITENTVETLDYWEQKLEYQTTTELAADSAADLSQSGVTFNQYQLVSPGIDGKIGTPDDIVMRDDLIINTPYKKPNHKMDSAKEK
ncbi:MAG: type II secretion system protein GspG [Blastocatellia bacterium]|nr:type II secretion system protein GspG [Blastocatellia bacterium]